MPEEKYELVKFVDNGFELEVNVSPKEETVWLNQEQLAALFMTSKQNIGMHISHILKERELDERTVKDFFTVRLEGNRRVTRSIRIYNLDMIISIGFRLKSKRGIVFRHWANSVLKQYLLKGYAIEQSRVMVSQENYINLVNVVTDMKSSQLRLEDRVDKLEYRYPDIGNKIFFQGQMWDATSCIEKIIGKAEESIILIDNYVDRNTLDLLSRKKPGVSVSIYTMKRHCELSEKERQDFNSQYGPLEIRYTDQFHARFLIIDRKTNYHVEASLKDAGAKAFAITVSEDEDELKEILNRL